MVRECAQSISRVKLPIEMSFLEKISWFKIIKKSLRRHFFGPTCIFYHFFKKILLLGLVELRWKK